MRDAVCTVNALSPTLYAGTGDFTTAAEGIFRVAAQCTADILRSEFFLPAPELQNRARGTRYAERTADTDLLRWWYCGDIEWFRLYVAWTRQCWGLRLPCLSGQQMTRYRSQLAIRLERPGVLALKHQDTRQAIQHALSGSVSCCGGGWDGSPGASLHTTV